MPIKYPYNVQSQEVNEQKIKFSKEKAPNILIVKPVINGKNS